MRAHVIEEPSLEFAGGARHVDPRFGVAEYGPADLVTPGAPRSIKIGLLGAQAKVDEIQRWLERCEEPINAKSDDRPGLWRAFPGFSTTVGYRSALVLDPRLQRAIKQSEMAMLESLDPRERVDAAVEMYLAELGTLVQQGRPDVVICHIPDALLGDCQRICARPIALRAELIERSLLDVAEEAMALSKMNWNSTRFDGGCR
jgi:hypothetical protein